MLDTLLSSPTIGAPWTRPVIAALLLHVVVIVVAVGSTASPSPGTRPVARDTIRLEMIQVKPSRPENAEASRSRPDLPIPAPPPVPDIQLNAPEFQLPSFSFSSPGSSESRRTSPHRDIRKPPVSLDSVPSVFSTNEVDQLPELAVELHPRYPEALQRAGMSGLVQVEYVVGSDGRVDERSLRVLASTHPAFLLTALEALGYARFRPARRGGQPVAVLVQQIIRFRSR
jgi:protein TonB